MNNTKENVIVFGAGNGYKFDKKYINNTFNVIAIVDNNPEKQGTILDGIEIQTPESIHGYEYDSILVTPAYKLSLEIKTQLEKMGIPKSKIKFHGDGGMTPFKIDPLFFASDLCGCDKKQLFSENMERVIIELNSKCNRQCWFCTNSLMDVCDNTDMSDEVFDKIINELAEIDYSQDICLSFFNEPLLCTKIIERIKIMRNKLPQSYIYLFSNGDYLNREMLDLLEGAGLDEIIVDIYINKFEFCIEEAKQRADKLLKKLDIEIEFDEIPTRIKGYKKYGSMDLVIISQDFSKSAANRAESLPETLPIPKITSHPMPCIKNFMSFHIDFRGDVWPCPNYHHEFEVHSQYCVGNVLEETIYDIYLGKKLTEYREKNFFHRDTLPCRSCIWDFKSFISNRFHHPFRDRPSIK